MILKKEFKKDDSWEFFAGPVNDVSEQMEFLLSLVGEEKENRDKIRKGRKWKNVCECDGIQEFCLLFAISLISNVNKHHMMMEQAELH